VPRWLLLLLLLLPAGLGCPTSSPDDDDSAPADDDDSVVPDDDDSVAPDDDDSVPDDDDSSGADDDDSSSLPDVPLPGLGDISGDCGLIDDELLSGAPYLFANVLDMGASEFDYDLLTEGGQEVWDDDNLGGSSLESEVMAYEVLARCELADLVKTESEILYIDEGGKKTDILVEITGIRIGVSVTRAYAWPEDAPYTIEQATGLLNDKLADVLLSSANVDPADAWAKQILHVMAFTADHGGSIQAAWADIEPSVKADTLLVVTVTDGNDDFIY